MNNLVFWEEANKHSSMFPYLFKRVSNLIVLYKIKMGEFMEKNGGDLII